MSMTLSYGHRIVTACGRRTVGLEVYHHATPVAFASSYAMSNRFPLLNDSNVIYVAHSSWLYNTQRFKHRSTKNSKTRESPAATDENEEVVELAVGILIASLLKLVPELVIMSLLSR